jgi:sulfate adenylyltransferase
LVPVIAPFQDARDSARKKNRCRFYRTFLSMQGLMNASEEMRRVITKKLLIKILGGFIGIETPFEPPINAEIVVDTKAEKVSESVHKIIVAIGELTVYE